MHGSFWFCFGLFLYFFCFVWWLIFKNGLVCIFGLFRLWSDFQNLVAWFVSYVLVWVLGWYVWVFGWLGSIGYLGDVIRLWVVCLTGSI